MLHNYIGTEHILLGLMREERSVACGILTEKGMRLARHARGHPRAAQREGRGRQDEGDAAALGVLAGPDRDGGARRPRPADRPGGRARAGDPGAVPPHPEQPGADRRAGRRQDGDRRGARDQRIVHGDVPSTSAEQAHARARHLADRRRNQVPRPVRGAAQDDHEGADRDREHHHLHRRAPHARRRRLGRGLARRGQHPEAGALARRDPVHRRHHARPSTASTSRRTGRSSGASSRSRSPRPRRTRRSRSCAG